MFNKNVIKFNFKPVIVAALAAFSSAGVTANDGTITFAGEVSAATCIITGGDNTSPNQGADFTVTLPKISTSALTTEKPYAGDTEFHITLSGNECPNGTNANVIFERAQSTNIDTATGYLKNTVVKDGAKNVMIRILNKDKKFLNLNSTNLNHQTVVITEHAARFDYWAQYVATGSTSPGTVKSDVVYSISYL